METISYGIYKIAMAANAIFHIIIVVLLVSDERTCKLRLLCVRKQKRKIN